MNNRHRFSFGFTLVEVTLALGIAVFCLVTTFGLLTVGSNSDATTFEQTRATNILAAVASDLRTFPQGTGGSTTPIYQINLQSAGRAADTYVTEDGRLNPAGAGGTRYRLGIAVQPGVAPSPTLVWVVLSWPAAATLGTANGSVESMIVLNRN